MNGNVGAQACVRVKRLAVRESFGVDTYRMDDRRGPDGRQHAPSIGAGAQRWLGENLGDSYQFAEDTALRTKVQDLAETSRHSP